MNRRYISVSVSIMLAAAVMTGCGKTEETTTATSEATTITISETSEETNATVAREVPDPEDIDIPSYNDLRYSDVVYSGFESTNGELEGQDELMRLRLDWGQPRRLFHDDLDWIEDPDTRALAESYEAEGYLIYQEIPALGDIEYEFTYGFGAMYMDGETYKWISVAKMNETLFNQFIRTGYRWESDEGEQYDDGTVIGYRYSNESSGYVLSLEFNRDTGFFTSFEEEPRPEYWHLDPRETNFDDEALEAYAQACFDRGYILDDASDYAQMYSSCSDGEYSCEEGFQYCDGDALVEYIAMEEGLFWIISGPDFNYCGGDYDVRDDDTIITVSYENESGEVSHIFIYDRATGIANIVNLW